jgi:FMN reductase
MSILLIAGSPSERSRSAALLDWVGQHLSHRGARVERLLIRDLSPQALLLADIANRSIRRAIGEVSRARAIVIATPIYKAAYSGVLKVFLDLLPPGALAGKTVLPLATGGSANHMLALDYALRPVLQSLSAQHILPSIYATDAQISETAQGVYQVNDDMARRLDDAMSALFSVGVRMPSGSFFEPIAFSSVRCSV